MELVNILLSFIDPITQPSLNFVGNIVQWLNGIVGNYGWTIVVFTILLKLITLPVDFWQRLSGKKAGAKLAMMEPMLEKIKKQFANDKQKQNEATMALHKKMGYKPMGSCLPIIITMAIFMIMFSGLNNYGHYTNVERYNQYQAVYYATVDAELAKGKSNAEAIEAGKTAVGDKFMETKESWLWVKNVWRPDTWNQVMPTYNQFVNGSLGVTGVGANAVSKEEYTIIFDAIIAREPGYKIIGDSGWNGLLILPLLAMAINFLSTKLSSGSMQMPGANATAAAQNKTMLLMMPLMMGVFGLFYTAAFAIYMSCNALLSVLSSLIINPIITNKVGKMVDKQAPKATYRR